MWLTKSGSTQFLHLNTTKRVRYQHQVHQVHQQSHTIASYHSPLLPFSFPLLSNPTSPQLLTSNQPPIPHPKQRNHQTHHTPQHQRIPHHNNHEHFSQRHSIASKPVSFRRHPFFSLFLLRRSCYSRDGVCYLWRFLTRVFGVEF